MTAVVARCRRLGGALAALGLRRGDRVAVVGPNCHRYLELHQGVPGAGMVIVPLNARHTARELAYALQDAGARVLFTGIEVASVPSCVEHVFDLGVRYEALLEGAREHAFLDADGATSRGSSTPVARPVPPRASCSRIAT